MKHNPALREAPRSEPASVIPAAGNSSILAWLEGTNRLLERDSVASKMSDTEEEEIDELMDGDDNDDDNDYDDDDNLELDD
jgi:hypothetical protein